MSHRLSHDPIIFTFCWLCQLYVAPNPVLAGFSVVLPTPPVIPTGAVRSTTQWRDLATAFN
jgi:hypothetical protein